MKHLQRITLNPEIMGGKPCIRGTRVTVGMILGLLSSGSTNAEIMKLYPYIEAENIKESLEYAAWRTSEYEVEIHSA